jgi:hypothetical protein
MWYTAMLPHGQMGSRIISYPDAKIPIPDNQLRPVAAMRQNTASPVSYSPN